MALLCSPSEERLVGSVGLEGRGGGGRKHVSLQRRYVSAVSAVINTKSVSVRLQGTHPRHHRLSAAKHPVSVLSQSTTHALCRHPSPCVHVLSCAL